MCIRYNYVCKGFLCLGLAIASSSLARQCLCLCRPKCSFHIPPMCLSLALLRCICIFCYKYSKQACIVIALATKSKISNERGKGQSPLRGLEQSSKVLSLGLIFRSYVCACGVKPGMTMCDCGTCIKTPYRFQAHKSACTFAAIMVY